MQKLGQKMPKKCVIFGSNGFIGKNLVKSLKDEETELVEITSSDIEYLFDLLDKTLFSSPLRKINIWLFDNYIFEPALSNDNCVILFSPN